MPVAATTAFQGLRFGELKPGQHVLINGASGGVGPYAVQIAKALGAEVTGVCSHRNVDMVRSLGADRVIDYEREDFSQKGPYNLVFDTVGNRGVMALKRAARPGGRVVIAGFMGIGKLLGHALGGLWFSKFGNVTIGMMPVASVNTADLLTLKNWVEKGKLKTVIDRQYSLEKTSEAIEYLESRHARAKVVIQMA